MYTKSPTLNHKNHHKPPSNIELTDFALSLQQVDRSYGDLDLKRLKTAKRVNSPAENTTR